MTLGLTTNKLLPQLNQWPPLHHLNRHRSPNSSLTLLTRTCPCPNKHHGTCRLLNKHIMYHNNTRHLCHTLPRPSGNRQDRHHLVTLDTSRSQFLIHNLVRHSIHHNNHQHTATSLCNSPRTVLPRRVLSLLLSSPPLGHLRRPLVLLPRAPALPTLQRTVRSAGPSEFLLRRPTGEYWTPGCHLVHQCAQTLGAVPVYEQRLTLQVPVPTGHYSGSGPVHGQKLSNFRPWSRSRPGNSCLCFDFCLQW